MEWRTVAVTVFVVSLCFLAIPIRIDPENSVEDEKLFEEYVRKYNKSYGHQPTEYGERFKRFKRSLRQIETLNGLRTSENSAYYGLTKYSDMSEDEFLQETLRPDISSRGGKHLGRAYHRKHGKLSQGERRRRASEVPLRVDWREKGLVTGVRSQGSCGACWAFSTVEVIESMFAKRNGTLIPLSVQEMVDCARNSNYGCEGGDICSLLTWLQLSKTRVVPESAYPLTWITGICKMTKLATKIPGVRVVDFTCDSFVDAEDELLLLLNDGPVAAAVNALSWQNYLGGIIQYHCDGSFEHLNHAVQIVGYDKSGPVPHYIVKNSWSSKFGDNGYMYIAIGANLCGIANQVSSVEVV